MAAMAATVPTALSMICDQLAEVDVKLNILPFLDGQQQLSADKVQEGHKIASVRIHIERAISRIKHFSILKSPLPLSMSRIANQIVTVCALLMNFQPVLIPVSTIEESATWKNITLLRAMMKVI